MGHIEHAGFTARPSVAVPDGLVWVLERHGETAKGHHLSAMGEVEVVEGGLA